MSVNSTAHQAHLHRLPDGGLVNEAGHHRSPDGTWSTLPAGAPIGRTGVLPDGSLVTVTVDSRIEEATLGPPSGPWQTVALPPGLSSEGLTAGAQAGQAVVCGRKSTQEDGRRDVACSRFDGTTFGALESRPGALQADVTDAHLVQMAQPPDGQIGTGFRAERLDTLGFESVGSSVVRGIAIEQFRATDGPGGQPHLTASVLVDNIWAVRHEVLDDSVDDGSWIDCAGTYPDVAVAPDGTVAVAYTRSVILNNLYRTTAVLVATRAP